MTAQQILDIAEEIIENLDPNEKNKDLRKLYRFIHSNNPVHSCRHKDWQEEFKGFIN